MASIFNSVTYRIERELGCVAFCRDGLEFYPASNKPDSEERPECDADLQATTQQTSCTSVLVQKQPPVYSHWSCDSAAQWRSLLSQASDFHFFFFFLTTLVVPFMNVFFCKNICLQCPGIRQWKLLLQGIKRPPSTVPCLEESDSDGARCGSSVDAQHHFLYWLNLFIFLLFSPSPDSSPSISQSMATNADCANRSSSLAGVRSFWTAFTLY